VPIGTSYIPLFLAWPEIQIIFVPPLVSVPISLKYLAPLSKTIGIFAKVSTLFTNVGFPNKPTSDNLGGLILGLPALPSIEFRSVEFSPQTYAPAPVNI